MLTSLHIENLAIIEKLDWQVCQKLTCISGETGAGKSVIISALKLILGQRADKSKIRTGSTKIKLQAVFNGKLPVMAQQLLADADILLEEDELIIRRTIDESTSKQYINDQQVTLQLLRNIGSYLIDVHGVYDQQVLFEKEQQRHFLDQFSKNQSLLSKYKTYWLSLVSLRKKLVEIEQVGSDSNIDYAAIWQSQINEIDQINLATVNEDKLAIQHRKLEHAVHLKKQAYKLQEQVAQIAEGLTVGYKLANNIAAIDDEFEDLQKAIASMNLQAREVLQEVADYERNIDWNADELSKLEQKIHAIEELKRKYGGNITAVLEHRANIEQQSLLLQGKQEKIASLTAEIAQCEQSLQEIAAQLNNRRTKGAEVMSCQITKQLLDLGFQDVNFKIAVSDKTLDKSGADEVEYLFSANRGQDYRPLASIASGGEISRVMLAIKSILTDYMETPLMIFDEIDANVGANVAKFIGEKMRHLSEQFQIIVITHSPQVAVCADAHYKVEKKVVADNTFSNCRQVQGDERVAEIVRMLGGEQNKQTLAMANMLLSGS